MTHQSSNRRIGVLAALALRYGCDKWGDHSYTQHYEVHFAPFRDQEIRVFEIGIGGYHDPKAGGSSLKMWKDYFPLASFAALDFYDKTALSDERTTIYQGDQSDEDLLHKINSESGPFDLIIDDGSHQNDHVIKSFQVLFPLLSNGGLYVVEDMQTAYWPALGGSPIDLNSTATSVGFFKGLVDGLNYREIPRPNYRPTWLDENVVSVCFYHNMVFVTKGDNTEESNILQSFEFPAHFSHLLVPKR